MTTPHQPTATAAVDEHDDTDSAASALDDTSRDDDPVAVSMMSDEME